MIIGFLSIELYLAHKHGRSIEEISTALEVPQDVIAERIETARLCVQHQIPFLAAR